MSARLALAALGLVTWTGWCSARPVARATGLAPRWSPLVPRWPRCVLLLHDSVPWWLVRRSRAALVSAAHSFSPLRARTPLEFGYSRQFHTGGCYSFDCPASQVKKTEVRPDCSFAPTQRPCVSDLLLLKGESWLRAETLDDSTPQRRISELRVWSYEPFIVFAPSSSGYTSGQNLEVLCILNNRNN